MFLVDAEAELRIKMVLQNEFLVKLAGEAHEQVFFFVMNAEILVYVAFVNIVIRDNQPIV